MPDFDIDFCQDRRDEVIAYVRQKYGSGNSSTAFIKAPHRIVREDFSPRLDVFA